MRLHALLLGLATITPNVATAADFQFRAQEIARDLTVGYAVSVADVNADKLPDIVVVDAGRVLWYENPSWAPHTIIDGGTRRDNVCLDPYDVDGDGQLDFALGADWKPFNTNSGGTIQWLSAAGKTGVPFDNRLIAEEPTVHRLRWADFDGDGRAELIVVPLMGRGSTAPLWQEAPLRILSFKIPANPRTDRWPMEVINADLHVAHNFHPTDFNDDGRLDMLVASFEGVSLLERSIEGKWSSSLIGSGNQQTLPNRGASEIKAGGFHTAAAAFPANKYIATIEPWHGFQVVVYTQPTAGETLWRRQVLDEQLKWGHAVSCANLDDDPAEELIIGVRDDQSDEFKSGLRIYDPPTDPLAADATWQRHLIDPGGVAIEDLTTADLNNDGRVDIIAAGRATKNVRIYWNE